MDAIIGHPPLMHRSRFLLAVLVGIALSIASTVTPVYAALPARWGFARVDAPTVPAWTNLNAPFQATSPASPVVQGGKIGTGRFQVRFLGIGVGSRGRGRAAAGGKKGQ